MAMRPLFLLSMAGLCVVCARFEALAVPNQASHSTNTHSTQTAGMQAGEYHTTITFSNVHGLPPAMAQHMIAHPQTTDACMNTSDINSVVQDSIAAGADMTCSQDHGSASGGVISGAASCHDNDGISGTLTIAGTYTAAHADVGADLNAQTPMGPVSEHIHLVSDRTGSCS